MNWRDECIDASICTAEGSSCENFLTTLFSALESSDVRYCVLHSWEELPYKLSSDLDLAVYPQDVPKLSLVFRALRERGYTPVQVFNYSVSAYYFVFFWLEGAVVRSVAIDVIFEHRRGGLIVPSVETLISDRRKHGAFWIPGPESEFTYLLAKKTWKGSAPAKQVTRLRVLVEQLGRHTAERLSGQLFLGNLKVRVVEACAGAQLDVMLAQISTQTWKTSLVRNPLRLTTFVVLEGIRCVRRWMQPTGFFVVVMGPDGVGKSTLIGQLLQVVGRGFRRYRVFHWRPMLLWRRRNTGDVTQPHSRPPHAGWWSIARLLAHVLDYWFGYWLVIRPLLARSGLAVFDRYFEDVLIDPKRYRYGGPLWVAQILRMLVPKPDLVLVLDAQEEVVLSRKQEVAPEEMQRQRQLYSGYKNTTSRARIIDATGSVQQVTAEAARAVIDCLAERFEHRHASWLSRSPS